MGRFGTEVFSKGYEGKPPKRKAKRSAPPRAGGGRFGTEVFSDGYEGKPPKKTKGRGSSPSGGSGSSSSQGSSAKKKARRKARQTQRQAARTLAESLRASGVGGIEDLERDPRVVAERARKQGARPPRRLKQENPRAAKRAEDARFKYIREHENLKEDPIAEAVIGGVATGGVGLGAKLATKAAPKIVSSVLGKGAGEAAESGAKAAARKAGRGVKARAGTAKARMDKNLAAHERNAAAKRASRRIRPKAKARAKAKARRYARNKRIRYGKEGRQVARRNREVRLGVAAPHLTATGAGVGALGVIGANIEGHLTANPVKAGKRTLEIPAGLITSTTDLAVQLAKAGVTGDTSGLQKRVSEDIEFNKKMAETLASGNPERIKKFVEDQGYIAPLLLAPSIAKTGRMLRSGKVPAAETGAVRRKARRKAARGELAKDAARAEAKAEAKVAAAGMPIIHAYQGRRGKRGVGKRRKLRNKPVDRGDVVALAAEEGLRPERAAENFEAVARKWADRPVFEDKRTGGVTGHDLIDYVRNDPKIWQDKAFWRAVDAYRAQEPEVRLSDRVIDIEQAKTYGVPLAEDRPTPTARREIPNVGSRDEVAAFIGKTGEGGKRVREMRDTIRSAEGRARQLRGELRQIEKAERLRQRRAGVKARGPEKGKPRLVPSALMNRRRSQLLDVEADIQGLRRELADTKRRHTDIARSLRDPAEDAALRREFNEELRAVREDRGLARGVYVPHTDVGREGLGVVQPVTRAGKKIYKRDTGAKSLAERGRVDYSLPKILESGVQAPRLRKEIHEFVRVAVSEKAIPIKRGETTTRIGTREDFERGLTPEQKQNTVLLPVSQFNQAARDGDVDALQGIVDSLVKEIDVAADKKGAKYAALDKDFAAELHNQLSAPGSTLHALQVLNRGVSRTILASPAWAAAQIVAEGLQALHAVNPLNPATYYHFAKGMQGRARMTPEQRTEFDAIMGAMPGLGSGPREFITAAGKMDQGLGKRIAGIDRGVAANFRRLERVMPIKRLIQAARLDWLRAIDRYKGGKIRVGVAVIKAHRDAVGFGAKLERVVKGQRELSERLSKMSPEERLLFSIRDTPATRRMEGYIDDMLGNWRAFSRHERKLASVLIFYPFLRMSLRWPFYTLPKRHPVRATIMYDLAASHNEQLRELLGGDPAWLGDYAQFILYGDEYAGGVQLTKASRVIPGANAIIEAASRGIDVSAQRAMNPVVGAINALINGIDPLSGEKVDPAHMSAEERFLARAGLATSVLLGMNPTVRAADQLRGSREGTSVPVVGPRRPDSALGDLLEELNGAPKERAIGTMFNPFPSQSLDEARDKAVMGRIFDTWRTSGSEAQDAVKNDDSLSEKEKARKLLEMKARSDEADKELVRLYKKYDISYKAEEKESLAEWGRLTYELDEILKPKKQERSSDPYLNSSSDGDPYLEAREGSGEKDPYLEATK